MPMFYDSNPLPRATFANFPAANSVPVGYQMVATNVGTNGITLYSDGTRWRPSGGRATVKDLGTAVAGIASGETIVMQHLFPAALLASGDTILFDGLALGKSGATDTGALMLRLGTGGTTADTSILTLANVMTAANLSWGGAFALKIVDATHARKIGSGAVAGGAGSFAGGSAGVVAASVVISNISNALYASLGINSSSTNNTVSFDGGQIIWITG